MHPVPPLGMWLLHRHLTVWALQSIREEQPVGEDKERVRRLCPLSLHLLLPVTLSSERGASWQGHPREHHVGIQRNSAAAADNAIA